MLDVTFAIPTYNSASTLMMVLQRCLMQDVTPKILVMDNGSKDGTVEMLQAAIDNGCFGKLNIRIQSVQRLLGGRDKNIPYVRFKICQAVDSEYLFFVDSDVLLPAHCTLGLKQMMDEDPNIVGAGIRVDPLADHIQMAAVLFKSEIIKQIRWNCVDGKCECRCALESLQQLNPKYRIALHPVFQAMHLKGF
jgi:glycosyltransferase involved in cell wall biosynthesis